MSEIHCFCPECYNDIEFISEPACKKCCVALPTSTFGDYCAWCIEHKRNFHQNKSVVRYDGKIKDIIHDLKFSKKPSIAKSLGHLMYSRYKSYLSNIDLIIPIPMESNKLIKRGYNQAQLIAKTICSLSGIPMEERLLKKNIVLHSQIELGRVDRYKNLEKAFEFIGNKNVINRKNILLVDDVMTTGATIDHAARILKKCGAKRVMSLTFARTY